MTPTDPFADAFGPDPDQIAADLDAAAAEVPLDAADQALAAGEEYDTRDRDEDASLLRADPRTLDADAISTMLDDFADPHARAEIIGRSIDAAKHAVRTRADHRRDTHRPDKVEHTADLRVEIAGASADADVLADLARTFDTAAKEARGVAGDLLDELPARGSRPRRSVKVADGYGYELTVKVEPRSELVVQHADVDDVLAAWCIARVDSSDNPDEVEVSYSAGVRDGFAALRSVLASSPTYRSTALDSLGKTLGDAGEDDLAKRLAAAYGKREKGEPGVKLERKPLAKPKQDEATS